MIKLYNLIKEFGLLQLIWFAFYKIESRIFDWQNNVNTHSNQNFGALSSFTNKDHGNHYQPTLVTPLRKILKHIHLPPSSVFVDIGCGKGRALLIASEFNFVEVVGVEFSKELCQIANENIIQYKQNKIKICLINVICDDAAEFEIRDCYNIFFMFNPFDNHVLEKLLTNIKKSLALTKRKCYFIYDNPKYVDTIKYHFVDIETINLTFGFRKFIIIEIL